MPLIQAIAEYISDEHIIFLNDKLKNCHDHVMANLLLKNITGINDFFDNQTSYLFFQQVLSNNHAQESDSERREYGDFQTPAELSDSICALLIKTDFHPQTIIEPTFGKGSFIISSLKYFNSIKTIFGIEINDRYVWETKLKILQYFLDNPRQSIPEIYLYNQDIFNFDFNLIKQKIDSYILVIGNPPWITNSELSALNSNNVPNKSNLKNLKGIDAITGKGNFDIGEFISLLMLETFADFNGKMGFLIKNSVIKNIVEDLKKFHFCISNIKTFKIDAKKFFSASVEASLFTCHLNQPSHDLICDAYENMMDHSVSVKFGWYKNKFISDLAAYKNSLDYDGRSPYEWRQGVKHDCAKVFELTKNENYYLNGFDEKIDIEDDLVYGLIKSSDLKSDMINHPRKYVIITQNFIGENTLYIKAKYPKLFAYLTKYQNLLNSRKSSMYKNKPHFSIFGIGDYSFKPYKIAISGLYKIPRFSLILPENGKCLMLDDTCYFLSYDKLEIALYTWCILTSKYVYNLLKTISFLDAKRPYTKEILMRISIAKLASEIKFDEIFEKINNLHINSPLNMNYKSWQKYLSSFEKL
ncbi:hypothetical protein L0128_02210 [candidate division KSB1 bacterium]|nr:hypothetical protein [candidate division KSB1 bacterium]